MTQREWQHLRWIEENPLISQQELAERAGITRSSVAVHISNLMKKGCIVGRGYLVRSTPYIVVIGGVNIDIGGISFRPMVPGDSNPGTVRTALGGVGRNIAHNLALLGTDTRMITALGDDSNAQRVIASCGELGIDISRSLTVPGGATSTYLFLSGPDGDMSYAVNDMDIYRHLVPRFFASRASLLDGAQLIIADTNIPRESLEWLSEHCTVPLFVDPVSTAKARRLQGLLGKIHTLKPNRIEAELLSGIAITDEKSLHLAADRLLSLGLQRIFLSLGKDGVLAADHSNRVLLPCLPAKSINTTGCGDAFMAAIGWAYQQQLNLEETARLGLAASAIAMEATETINSAMSACALLERARIHDASETFQ